MKLFYLTLVFFKESVVYEEFYHRINKIEFWNQKITIILDCKR